MQGQTQRTILITICAAMLGACASADPAGGSEIQDDAEFRVSHGEAQSSSADGTDLPPYDDADEVLTAPAQPAPADAREGLVEVGQLDVIDAELPADPEAQQPASSDPEVGVSAQALADCSGITLTRWPLDGTNGVNWMIFNYTDRNAAVGTRDYTGQTGALARTYEGHSGLDITIPTFREMDNGSAVVRAALAGTVVSVVQNNFDRETSNPSPCNRPWNVVEVDHGNGYHAFYGHIRKNSARVKVGDAVSAGTILAVVGSAGCSSAPHLHFQLSCGGVVLEPLSPNVWSSPPSYRPTSQVMDTVIRANGAPTTAQIVDPAPDATLVAPNSLLGIGASITGSQGDVVHVRILRPNGTTHASFDQTLAGNARYLQQYPSFQFWLGSDAGTWRATVQVNSGRTVSKSFKLSQASLRNVAAASYQSAFDAIVAQGYRPIYVDGFNVGNSTFYNALFKANDGVGWLARHALTAAQFQAEFDNRPAGYRPLQLGSLRQGAELRYTLILVNDAGTSWSVYHGRTNAQHQTLADQLVASGMRMVSDSPTTLNGVTYHTALYDRVAVGAWEARYGLSAAQYQTLVNTNVAAGRVPAHIEVDSSGVTPLFEVIFNSRAIGGWSLRHNLTAAGFDTERQSNESAGRLTRSMAGYNQNGTANFAAYWSQL
jgi:murein DD-endopeptidase MepM/ murein hydrolase activator NlpD